MKKTAVISQAVGVMLIAYAQAYASSPLEPDLGVQQWQGTELVSAAGARGYPGEWQGAGIGGLSGALLAGPPGFIVGAVGGLLVGRSGGLESALQNAQQDVAQLQREQQSASRQLTQLSRQLEREKTRRQQQRDAIAAGFIYHVHFRTGEDTVEPDDLAGLKELAEALRSLPDLRLLVHAHADRRGLAGVNQQLSEARAQRVVRQLVRHGVAPGRIVIQAHGEADARYPSDDREGLGYDRRVVIRFQPGAAL